MSSARSRDDVTFFRRPEDVLNTSVFAGKDLKRLKNLKLYLNHRYKTQDMYLSLEWDLKLELRSELPFWLPKCIKSFTLSLLLFYVYFYLYLRRNTFRQTDRQTDRQTGRQTGRQTDRQKDRQTDRQTKKQTGLSKYFFVHSDDLKIPSLQEATIQELNEVIKFFQMFETSVSWSKNGQTHWQQPTNCLSVSDHFVRLAIKWFMVYSNKKRLSWKIHKRKINSSLKKCILSIIRKKRLLNYPYFNHVVRRLLK